MINKMATLLVVLLLSFTVQASSIVTGDAYVGGPHSVSLSSTLTVTSGGSGQAAIYYILTDNANNSTRYWGGFNFTQGSVTGTFQNSKTISNLTESSTYEWAAAIVDTSTNAIIALGSTKQFTTLAVPGFKINAGLNDAWYDPDTDGQGFFITVFPELGVVVLAWFTYDTALPPDDATANLGDPGHRWLTAVGKFIGNRAVLDIEIASGGIFDAASEVQRILDGTIRLTFDGCNSGTVEYDIPSIDQTGIVPIQRVAIDNIVVCEALSADGDAFEFGKGIFALNPRLRPVSDEILTHPHTAGVLLIGSWASIASDEFVENNDWSYFTTEGAKIVAAGKELSLMISFVGTSVPDWVIDRGVQTVTITETNPEIPTFGDELTVPVMWDPILVQEQVALIENMGSQFSGDPNVKVVNIQCVSTSGADWSPPRTIEENQAFLDAGYTNERMFEACKQIIDAAFMVFPDKIISFSMGPLSKQLTGNTDKDAFAKDLIAYIKSNWPDNAFYLARMNLHAKVPDPREGDNLGGWEVMHTNAEDTTDNVRTSAQMVAAATDLTSCRMNGKEFPCDAEANLSGAADLGVNVYGMRYLEIFVVDLLAPELQDELAVIKQNIENGE